MHGLTSIHSSALASAIQSDSLSFIIKVGASQFGVTDLRFLLNRLLDHTNQKANTWVSLQNFSDSVYYNGWNTPFIRSFHSSVLRSTEWLPQYQMLIIPLCDVEPNLNVTKFCGPPIFCNRKIGALSKRWGQNTVRALMTFLWMSDLFLIWLDNLYWNAEADQFLLGSKPGHHIDWYPRP